MDFPAYIPAAVREHLAHYLEGERERDIPSYIELLANAEARLAEIESAIEGRKQRGEIDYLGRLQKQKAEAANSRDVYARDVNCLRRLAHDTRMREAITLLTHDISDDQQWRGFIHSAWAADIDFSGFRESRKRAIELTVEIADAAANLAKLIRQFSGTGMSGPSEFYSIPELLRQTDSDERQGHNLYMWRAMRAYVLGDPPRRDVPEKTQGQGGNEQLAEPVIVIRRTFVEVGENPGIDPAERRRAELNYAWDTAPELAEILDTVESVARQWEPNKTGFIAAAIESRQRNPKTEYLRAFANLLTKGQNFALTTQIMKAMAIVANVVINLPDVDVTYDDVRKALAMPGG